MSAYWSIAHCPYNCEYRQSYRSYNIVLLKQSLDFISCQETSCGSALSKKCISTIVNLIVITTLLQMCALNCCYQRIFNKQTNYFSTHRISIIFSNMRAGFFFKFVNLGEYYYVTFVYVVANPSVVCL